MIRSVRPSPEDSKPRAREVVGRVQIQQDSRIIYINIDDAGRISVYHHPRALVLRSIKEFAEERAVEQHRMPSTAAMARNRDGLSGLPVRIDHRGEGLGLHRRMIRQMNQRRGRVGRQRADCHLDRGQLASNPVGIVDHLDARISRDRRADAVGMRSDDDGQPRDNLEHRGSQMRQESLVANL